MTRNLARHTRSRKFTAVAAGVGLLAGGLIGGIALADEAADVDFSGGGVVGHRVATESVAFSVPALNTWATLPGSRLSYAVPSGSARLVTAEFTAASDCFGEPNKKCNVRIVARKSTSSTLYEFYPRTGTDFAFDTGTGGDDFFEAHAIKRSIRLGSGTWYFYVQAYKPISTFVLDDWHFDINVHTAS